MFAVFAIAVMCMSPPVSGAVVAPYAPIGQYGGHWGIDYAAIEGSVVRAPTSGLVTFSGSVAGMNTITIEPVPGFKVSVSYLESLAVSAGSRVTRGQVVARSGRPHGSPGVHLSTRINGTYVNPAPLLGCRSTDISRALRLVTPPQPYARKRANRNSRRDIRPDTRRSPARSRLRTPRSQARPGSDHAGGGSVAEVRQRRFPRQ